MYFETNTNIDNYKMYTTQPETNEYIYIVSPELAKYNIQISYEYRRETEHEIKSPV